ncbi:MAG: LCP family protein [Actinobacteria bacterium]|nr:LCP family protein [Actinomycetota bacterium]
MFEDRPERVAPWKLFLAGSFVIALVAASVATITAFANRQDVVATLEEQAYDDGVSDYLQAPTGGPQTILLIGSDRRKEYKKWGVKPLSDTMMLVRLDPDLEVTPVLSIPRDLKVSIPGHGTDKINAAYSLGGAKLSIQTITEATGIKINHVVNTDFRGFIQAVDKIGCVYTDVDRRYFNDNTGAYVRDAYAAINIRAGYQKLCGPKALDYVRFRHLDSDIVRGARQQSFLRQAKQQVGIEKLFANAKSLKNIIAKNTRTDRGLANGRNLQRLLSLGVSSAGNPIYQVQIPNLTYDNVPGGASYVIASDSSLRKAARTFENGPKVKRKSSSSGSGSSARKKSKKKQSSGSLASGLVYAKDEGKAQAVRAGFGVKLPVYYPTVKLGGSSYKDNHTRSYRMTTDSGDRVSAWRIVVETREVGEYYGIQGINWEDPPILKDPSETRKIGGRTFQLYYEGDKLGTVAFKKDGASFYVQNTLTRKLSEKQMLGIAASLRKRK